MRQNSNGKSNKTRHHLNKKKDKKLDCDTLSFMHGKTGTLNQVMNPSLLQQIKIEP